MAATEPRNVPSILAAAMALPGLAVAPLVHAEGKPEGSSVGLRTLAYQDSQPGLRRVSVIAPTFQVITSLGDEDWWLSGTLTSDSVSGATPRYHTAVSGASRMSDRRTAGDVKVTRYFERLSLGGGLAGSNERDYKSIAGSFDLRWASDDQNTEVSVSIGGSSDAINPVNLIVVDASRESQQFALGVTKVASRTDVLHASLSYSGSRGYHSDPYKVLDERPRERRQTVLMLRWNHHFAEGGSTLRSSYRATQDSWSVQSHTLTAEWVVPTTASLKLVPSLRAYTQTAAEFYAEAIYDPVLGEPFPVGYDRNNPPRYITLDQRLSSFGALGVGLGFIFDLDREWSVDGKAEAYEQRSRWAWDGNGAIGLAPFRAYQVQIGVTRRF